MEVKKNELFIVPCCMSFNEKFIIEDDINLSLNNMKVYSTDGTKLGKQVNFEIKVINNKKVIYPLEYADSFVLFAERLVSATKIEIKAEDYFSVTNNYGNYEFILNNN